MRRKVLFGIDYTDSELIKVLLYLFVGGTAALVEWALFYIFLHYLPGGLDMSLTALTMTATALAFCLSTLYHYFLGNVLVFDSGSRYDKGKELSLVFLVSMMGLGFNLLLMYAFVSLLGWQPMLSKVLTSCIVVVWNYLSRKKWIFRS
ncbi:GtrA family protein [uncultured Phascolarctobacterium sp.]|uniref:GtrA family protein n=1 Tax=uncultured Phascolarctobacterium sp. TaxID=512296 RepID=UPI00262A618E|nr:GtrA family protein [uncultured Phascolarctobacterium sp.]